MSSPARRVAQSSLNSARVNTPKSAISSNCDFFMLSVQYTQSTKSVTSRRRFRDLDRIHCNVQEVLSFSVVVGRVYYENLTRLLGHSFINTKWFFIFHGERKMKFLHYFRIKNNTKICYSIWSMNSLCTKSSIIIMPAVVSARKYRSWSNLPSGPNNNVTFASIANLNKSVANVCNFYWFWI